MLDGIQHHFEYVLQISPDGHPSWVLHSGTPILYDIVQDLRCTKEECL